MKCNSYPEEKKFYSPRLTQKGSITVRRLAWFLGINMTKAIDIIINELSLIFPASEICPKCQDKSKCKVCGFYDQKTAVKAEITAEEETAKAA